MSSGSGTPVGGGGYMRHRYSQGYASGDDLEDDACSRSIFQAPSLPKTRKWVDVLENLIWIASAIFIIYYGDMHSNFIYLIWHDGRIKRIPLYVGFVGVGLNLVFFMYTSMSSFGIRKFGETWEVSSTAALPFITALGVISFSLFCFALWPIWSFLALPLVFTLFMASMVILPCLVLERFKEQTDFFRTD